MKWTSAISTHPSLEAAVNEVVDKAQIALGQSADLAFVFISDAFASEYSRLMPLLKMRLGATPILGCGGGGIIGQSASGRPQEIEDEPAISLTLASLPNVKVYPFHLRPETLPDLDSSPDAWVDIIGVDPAEKPHLFC
jgi:small ligand-binding sensory domain FIST